MIDKIEIRDSSYTGTCIDYKSARQEVLNALIKYECSIAGLKYIVDDILNCIIVRIKLT